MLLPALGSVLLLLATPAQSVPSGDVVEDRFNIAERLSALEERTKHLVQPFTIDSCAEARQSGTYQLRLPLSTVSVPVVCETNATLFSNGEADAAGGAWLVFQQRLDGSVNFGRSSADYRGGFGTVDPRSEFWLGLEVLHQLTKNAHYELVIELRNEEDSYGYVRYSQFGVAGEADRYKLASLGSHSGTLEGKLTVSRGEPFYSKADVSSDGRPPCDATPSGGWWFYECRNSNLNGPFAKDGYSGRGIFWRDFANAATYSRMMIRRTVPSIGSNEDRRYRW